MKSIIAIVAFAIAAPAFAGIYDELSPADQAKVQRGEQVFITKDVGGAPWPDATLYMRFEATPEEAVAVFWDVNDHKNYIPNLLKSVITQRISANVVQADYTLDVPFPVSDENYTVRDTVTGDASKETYAIAWAMIRADSTKKIEGSVRFEKLGTGAIMAYRNFVVPGSGLAGIGAIRDQAMKQVRQTGQAVAARAVSLKAKNPAKLQAEVEAVRAALR